MKITLILFLISVLAFPVFSQEKSDVTTEKNVLKLNTLSLFVITPSIFYEHKISDMTSAQVGVGYLGYKVSDVRFTGLFLTPEFRIYPKKDAIDGFYIAPYFRYMNLSVKSTTENTNASLSVVGGGLLFGRQWITKSGFNMDLFFGGHYASGSARADSESTNWFDSNLFSGFRTRVGFALGFAF